MGRRVNCSDLLGGGLIQWHTLLDGQPQRMLNAGANRYEGAREPNDCSEKRELAAEGIVRSCGDRSAEDPKYTR
jgi:hypothetical protein